MRNPLFLILLTLCASITTKAQSNNTSIKEKIQKAHQSFIDAILAEDYVKVDTLLADDVTLGFPHGGFTPKQEYVNGLRNKTLYYDSSANQKSNIRIYGKTGVVNGTGDLVFRYKYEGEWYKMLEHLSFTAVYVLDKDRVKMVSWQSNRPTSDSTVKVTQ